MDRVPVRSSNMRSVGYDRETETLEVEFQSGDIYRYFHVPERVHEGLIRASSKGSYFHDNIRERYRFRKVK